MSRNELTVTVVGWAATSPREVVGAGVPYTSFRLATTPRWFDPRAGGWADGRTEWITVKAFRDVAVNIADSIRKGDPVVAHGRLRTEEWEGENGLRSGLALDVTALGHDLTRGRSSFVRRVHVSSSAGADGATGGGPAARSDDDPWAAGPAPQDDVDLAADGGPADDLGDDLEDESGAGLGEEVPRLDAVG